MPKDVADLVGVEPGIDGDQHAARRRDGEVGLEQGRDIGAEEGHAVVLLEPRGA